MTWTDERKAEAIRLSKDGWSCAQIAKKLGGISRNAVIGILHRTGNAHISRPVPSGPGAPKARARADVYSPDSKPKAGRPAASPWERNTDKAPPPAPKLRVADVQSEGVDLLSLTGCKYPTNKARPGEEHLFCNRARKGGDGPYCKEHADICFNPVPVKRRAA